NVKQAAYDIVMSKSFDNGMVCASEQAAIIDKEIYDEFCDEMKSYHTYFVNKAEKAKLEEFCFGAKANSKYCADAKLNADIVGKPATWIAEQAGFTVPEGTNILDRKSTRLNSSHVSISYAVFCLKKKNNINCQ